MAVCLPYRSRLFTNTDLLKCIFYVQKAEGPRLNKSDVVVCMLGGHEVVSVGPGVLVPRWGRGVRG